MNIESQKKALARIILEIDNPTLLDAVKSAITNFKNQDSRVTFTEKQKYNIESELAELANEEIVAYEGTTQTLKIYVDTSVFGGYYDDEFSEVTRLLFDEIHNNKYQVVISDLTEKELLNAPEKVRSLLNKINDSIDKVKVSREAIELAQKYVQEKVVGKTSLDDCIHIATATINRIDVLVSWNFKHIVNIQRIKGYNSINSDCGYQLLEIRSPKDLIDYENLQE